MKPAKNMALTTKMLRMKYRGFFKRPYAAVELTYEVPHRPVFLIENLLNVFISSTIQI